MAATPAQTVLSCVSESCSKKNDPRLECQKVEINPVVHTYVHRWLFSEKKGALLNMGQYGVCIKIYK